MSFDPTGAVLSLGLAFVFERAWSPRKPGLSAGRRAAGLILLAALAASSLGWLGVRARLGPGEFPPPLGSGELAYRAALALVLGALSFFHLRDGLAAGGRGLLAGVVFCALGLCARWWLSVSAAWTLIGWFSGGLIWQLLPFLLAVSLAAAAALLHAELSAGAMGGLAALLLAWSAPAAAAQWRLSSAWGFGPASLSEAAALAPVEKSEEVLVAWLRPEGGAQYRVERQRISVDSVNLSVDNLDKLYHYLKAREFRSVFGRQALKALRRGWLLWWDADRALEAAMLGQPGRAIPDYRSALGLIKAGPLTVKRFQRLQELEVVAKPRREGFEDITQSQYIFEGFSAAYARFGDEEQARSWLYKVDNLWPVYEKKIEVSPLETMHDGAVSGSLLLEGSPGSAVMVGLFFVTSSTSSAKVEATLSSSDFPDSEGRFAFSSLGAGRYFLGLMAHPDQLEGRIVESPGVFQLSESTPSVKLEPIRVERR